MCPGLGRQKVLLVCLRFLSLPLPSPSLPSAFHRRGDYTSFFISLSKEQLHVLCECYSGRQYTLPDFDCVAHSCTCGSGEARREGRGRWSAPARMIIAGTGKQRSVRGGLLRPEEGSLSVSLLFVSRAALHFEQGRTMGEGDGACICEFALACITAHRWIYVAKYSAVHVHVIVLCNSVHALAISALL